jgi:hypothetical protein
MEKKRNISESEREKEGNKITTSKNNPKHHA